MGLFDDPVGYLNGGLYGPAGQDLTNYLGKVVSGQYALQGIQGANDAFRNNDYEALAGMFGPGAIKAYHGSPYDFTKFDASKIGTGEGAQAYGHGLYFADVEDVARQYKDKLATDKAGKMYEVNIKAEPEQFLDWDKPLAQQPKPVRDAMDKLRQQGGENLAIQTASPQPTGQTFYQGLAQHLSDQGAPFSGLMRGWEQEGEYLRPRSPDVAGASQALNQAGIPGIRYLDQGSRGAGQGTSNYVAFDPGIIEILRKYGLGGLTAGAGATGGLYGSNTQY